MSQIFVVDYNNNRVKRWSSLTSYLANEDAEAVLGQDDFTGSSANKGGTTSASGLASPRSLAMDSKGNLYVSDNGNYRVLRFDNAANKANGAAADGVIGQTSFTGNTGATERGRLNFPGGVFVDSKDRLWVADSSNHRVLRYDSPATLDGSGGSATNADAVIGQSSWTTKVSATTRSGLNGPWVVYVDSSNRLWIMDQYNSRVLRFDNADTLDGSGGTAPEASAVIGQASFTSDVNGVTASLLSGEERGLWLDDQGNLWVTDTNNHRVLRFSNAATLDGSGGTAPEADLVLGQYVFTTRNKNAGAGDSSVVSNGFLYPEGLVVMDGRLMLADVRNNRILIFALYPVVETTALSNMTGVSAQSGGNVTDDVGKTITARGVCWNTSGSPTTQDSCTSDGTGSGSFSSTLTGLSSQTTYYVRAYATNSAGTGYGSELSFSTTTGGAADAPLPLVWACIFVGLLLAGGVFRQQLRKN